MDRCYNGMMQVAGVYGEEVIVSSEAPEQRGSESSGEERREDKRRGVEWRGRQTRTDYNGLKHNNQHNVGMNCSPPFSHVEDEGQL